MFKQLETHTDSIENFGLGWRFNNPEGQVLPEIHLQQLKPLDEKGARVVWDFLLNSGLHNQLLFGDGFFSSVRSLQTEENDISNDKIKKWLYQTALPFEQKIILSWEPYAALLTTWKIFLKYFDDFWHPSDDLTVFDPSLNWGLLLHHHGEIFFGANKP